MLNLYPFTSGRLSIRNNGNSILGYDCNVKKWINLNGSLENLLFYCDGKNTVNNICDKLSKRYNSSQSVIREKVMPALSSLKNEGVIKLGERTNPKQIRFRDYEFKWPLQSVFIEITEKCNLKCIHCYREASPDLNQELNKEDVYSFLNQIDEMGTFNVFFTGGEPFMRKDFEDILENVYNKGFEIGIFTNGTISSPERLILLEKIKPKFVAVSLESLEDSKYRKIRKIRKIKK